MKRYEYEFISVSCTTTNTFMPIAYEHREVIADHAANGYRYVDSIVTESDSHGGAKKIDLVFEREVED